MESGLLQKAEVRSLITRMTRPDTPKSDIEFITNVFVQYSRESEAKSARV